MCNLIPTPNCWGFLPLHDDKMLCDDDNYFMEDCDGVCDMCNRTCNYSQDYDGFICNDDDIISDAIKQPEEEPIDYMKIIREISKK